jgi:asparaginyl-tRNA synthetase
VVEVAGWVKSSRIAGGGEFMFLELSDGSTVTSLQVVAFKDVPNWEEVAKIKTAYCVRVKGVVVRSEGKGQNVEVKVGKDGNIRVLGKSDDEKYPLAAKYHKLETLRQYAHLRPRTNLISTVARVKNNVAYATHNFFQQNGFLYVHTPIITTSDCEGAGEMFRVTTLPPGSKEDHTKDFFKKQAYLTVSGQLAVENYCCSLSKVYTFGPTFRAEVSNTTRHMAEFWMIEPELAFTELKDVMDCA